MMRDRGLGTVPARSETAFQRCSCRRDAPADTALPGRRAAWFLRYTGHFRHLPERDRRESPAATSLPVGEKSIACLRYPSLPYFASASSCSNQDPNVVIGTSYSLIFIPVIWHSQRPLPDDLFPPIASS